MKSKRSKILLSFIMLVYAIVIGGLLAAIIEVPEARLSTILLSGTPATTGTVDNCPDATYAFAWTGDNTSGSDYACTSNGTSSVQAASSGGSLAYGTSYGENGDGVQINAADEYLLFTASGGDIIDDEASTIWFSIRTNGDVDMANPPPYIFESYLGGSNANELYGYVRPDEDVATIAWGASTGESWNGADADITNGEWHRIGVSWDAASGYLCVDTDDQSWANCSGSNTFTAWNDGSPADPDDFTIGENQTGNAFTWEIHMDNIYIVTTYKAADPMP